MTHLNHPAPPPPTLPRAVGEAEASFFRDEAGRTRLGSLYQKAPLRLLRPTVPPDGPVEVAITNTSGGLVGGDALTISLTAGPGTQVLAVAQAAEKVYRARDDQETSRWEVSLTTGAGAWLEWLPQETIVFDRARLRRSTVLQVAEGGQALAGEMLVFGRAAHGETLSTGLLREVWEVWREGRLVWADALHLNDSLRPLLDHPAGLAGAGATATAVLVGPEPEEHRDSLRTLSPGAGVQRAATVVNGLLVVRWLAIEPLALRGDFATVWKHLRQRAAGLPPTVPRLWDI